MPMTRRALLGTSAAFALCGPAAAQVWPDRPIRLIVPFPPGSGTDVISRQLAERVGANTRWTIVIENRAGAGGTLGLDAVAKAPPDGYTIGMGQASNLMPVVAKICSDLPHAYIPRIVTVEHHADLHIENSPPPRTSRRWQVIRSLA